MAFDQGIADRIRTHSAAYERRVCRGAVRRTPVQGDPHDMEKHARTASGEAGTMSGIRDKRREQLSDDQFADVSGDERKLPIHDEDHVRNPAQRFGQTEFRHPSDKQEAAKKVLRAARDHGIEVTTTMTW